MIFDEIVKAVSDECPPFNDYALRGFVRQHINESPAFPAMVLEEGFKLVGGALELAGYEIMSPEDTVRYELTSGSGKSGKAKIPLTVTHMRLVRYDIRFGENHLQTYLYMPYMHDDLLRIRDKPSMIRKVILEQTFSRVQEKDKDGMSFSPIRVNLTFNRRNTFKIHSYTSGGFYDHFVVTSRLFHGNIPSKRYGETTLVHYMLAKFGFVKTLTKFGLLRADIDFTDRIHDDTDQFEYFEAKEQGNNGGDIPDLFLRVRKTLLGDDQTKKFVVNLLYTLSHFRIQAIDNVYAEQGSIWKIMLGVILFPDPAGPKAHSNAESHLNSVDSFIDPMARDRLRAFGVMIDDIYDLLVYVFGEIDSFMVNNQVQDLYNSRLDVQNGLLVKSYGTRITKQIYPLAKRSNITLRDVKHALRLPAMMFRHTSSARPDEDKDYVAPPEIINDNWIFSGGLSKIRMGGRAEQRLHPSMVVGESINAFVGKTIGRTGYMNPFVQTDRNGAILHPEYAAEIDSIKAFLPR